MTPEQRRSIGKVVDRSARGLLLSALLLGSNGLGGGKIAIPQFMKPRIAEAAASYSPSSQESPFEVSLREAIQVIETKDTEAISRIFSQYGTAWTRLDEWIDVSETEMLAKFEQSFAKATPKCVGMGIPGRTASSIYVTFEGLGVGTDQDLSGASRIIFQRDDSDFTWKLSKVEELSRRELKLLEAEMEPCPITEPALVAEVEPEPNIELPHGEMVFTADHEGNSEVYVSNLDGTNFRNVSNTPDQQEIEARWLRDGSGIVASSLVFDSTGVVNSEIISISLGAGEANTIINTVQGESAFNLEPTPDSLIYEGYMWDEAMMLETHQLKKVDLATGEVSNIVIEGDQAPYNIRARVSPDGQYIAYTALGWEPTETDGIYISPSDKIILPF